MNARERYINSLSFEKTDRVFHSFGGPRASTLLAWQRQGLPKTITDTDVFRTFVGSDPMKSIDCVDVGPLPAFGPERIEDIDGRKIMVIVPLRPDEPDGPLWKTIRYKASELPTPGFETHTVREAPVTDRSTWEEVAARFDPEDESRYAEDWLRRVEGWRTRDYPLSVTFVGLWMQTRRWCSLEGLCRLCIDDPDLVFEMFEFWADFCLRVYARVFEQVAPDHVLLDEDIAYKTASMISPDMVKRLMWPPYRRIVRSLKDLGVPLLSVASDGYLGELIPLWLDAGFAGAHPLEIAAGNDLLEYRAEYGKRLFMQGGIDKRELLMGKEEVWDEVMSKVPVLLEGGGYVPGIDHAVPPDVPLRNFLYYTELIRELSFGRRPERGKPIGELEQQLGPIERMWSPDQILGRDLEITDYGKHSFVRREGAQS